MEIYWTILKNNLKKAIVACSRENLLPMTQHAADEKIKFFLMTHFHDLLLLLLVLIFNIFNDQKTCRKS
jgi:hypothetical protein